MHSLLVGIAICFTGRSLHVENFILILLVNESFIFIDHKMFFISRVVDEDRQLRQVQCCCPGNRLKLLTSGQHWQEFSVSVPSSVTPRYVSLLIPSKCGWGHRRLCVSKLGGSPHLALLFPFLYSLSPKSTRVSGELCKQGPGQTPAANAFCVFRLQEITSEC